MYKFSEAAISPGEGQNQKLRVESTTSIFSTLDNIIIFITM